MLPNRNLSTRRSPQSPAREARFPGRSLIPAALATLVGWAGPSGCADLKPPPAALAGASSANVGGRADDVGGRDPGGDAGRAGGASSGAATSSLGGSAAASGGSAATATGGLPSTGGSSSGGQSHDGGASSAGQAGTDSCQSKTSGEIRAWLYQEITTPISNELHPFLALTTSGSDVPLSQLAIRYYFTAEMSGDWQVDCIWVTTPGGSGSGLCESGTTMKIVSLDPPRPEADHYLEVSFAQVSGGTLSSVPTPVFEARSMFWRAGHPMMNQDNDYSFVPTTNEVLEVEARVYKQTSRVTVYRNGGLVWGEEPCP